MGLGVVDGLARLAWLANLQVHEPVLTGDSWILVSRDGLSLPAWLLEQHNEHRIVFTKLVSVIESTILGIPPTSSALYQVFILTLVNIGLLYGIVRANFKGRLYQWLTWLSCSLLLMTPWQWENFSWEFQSPWIFSNTLVLLATWLCCRKDQFTGKKQTAIMLLLMAVIPWMAIFNIGQGLAISLSLCIATALISRRLAIVTATSSLLAVGTYFWLLPYAKPVGHPTIQFDISYFISILLGGEWKCMRIIAISFLLLILALKSAKGKLFSQLIRTKAALLLPGLFSILFAAMTTLSRSGYGVGQASASRYITHSLMLAISLVLVSSALLESQFGKAQTRPPWSYHQLAPSLVVVLSALIWPLAALSGSDQGPYLEYWNRAATNYRTHNLAFRCDAQAASGIRHPHDNVSGRRIGKDSQATTKTNYFTHSLETKPTAWHQDVMTGRALEQLHLQSHDPVIRYKLESAMITQSGIRLAGWAFNAANFCDQLFIQASYANGVKWAGLINSQRPDIETLYGLASVSSGFDMDIPLSTADGSPIKSLTISGNKTSLNLSSLIHAKDRGLLSP